MNDAPLVWQIGNAHSELCRRHSCEVSGSTERDKERGLTRKGIVRGSLVRPGFGDVVW
jgi:hypothetical protein